MKKILVTAKTPWPHSLPEGTEIISVEPRQRENGEKYPGYWFERVDGKKIDGGEVDAKFRLYDDEWEEYS